MMSVVFALLLLFDSGLVTPESAQLSFNTQQYVANVIGVTAAVDPTPLNLKTAELTQKEQELVAREQAVKEREIKVSQTSNSASGSSQSTFILSIILFILLVLIVLNYGLDFARARQQQSVYAQSS